MLALALLAAGCQLPAGHADAWLESIEALEQRPFAYSVEVTWIRIELAWPEGRGRVGRARGPAADVRAMIVVVD